MLGQNLSTLQTTHMSKMTVALKMRVDGTSHSQLQRKGRQKDKQGCLVLIKRISQGKRNKKGKRQGGQMQSENN
jgi:ribosomal protein L15E